MTPLICLSLKDCSVLTVDLPPLKEKETRRAVELRLPRLFPRPLEGKIWDIVRKDDQILIFLIEADMLKLLKEKYGSSLVINSTAQLILISEGEDRDKAQKNSPNQPGVYKYSGPHGWDIFFMRGKRLEQAVHLPPEGDLMPLLSYHGGEDCYVKELKKSQCQPLFREKTSLSFKSWLPPVLILLVLIYLAFSFTEVHHLQNLVQKQQWEIDQKRKTLSTRSNDYPWEKNLTDLEEALPQDFYLLIYDLYKGFQGRGIIHTLMIQGKEIRLEAQGHNALMIMEDLISQKILIDLTLHQINHYEEEEVFTISGSRR